MRQQIIEFIKRNKTSTTKVADCLNKTGALANVLPLNKGKFAVGEVKWVYALDCCNYPTHEMLRDAQKDTIILIEAINCGTRAVIGELVAKYLIDHCKCAAIVSLAPYRDGTEMIQLGFPLWGTGLNPIGCFNTKPTVPLSSEIEKEHLDLYEGAIAVCDDTGVVIIPKSEHTQEFLTKLENMEAQETTWFDCLANRNMDTFEIVCLKKYLND